MSIKGFFFVFLVFLGACAFFRPRCPIPNCKIRQEHRHALTFSDEVRKGNYSYEKELKKQLEEQEQEKEDEALIEAEKDISPEQMQADSIATAEADEKERLKIEKELAKAEKERLKAEKKKQKEEAKMTDEERMALEEKLYEDEGEYTSSDSDKLTETEIKKKEKEDKAKAKKVDEEGKDEGNDILRVWRSRITEWWKRNQRPKIGEDWKRPKRT